MKRTMRIKKQRAMATLILVMILLFASSIILLYSSRGVLVEQKISTNNYRSEQAFYSAMNTAYYVAGKIAAKPSLVYETSNLDILNPPNARKQASFQLAQITSADSTGKEGQPVTDFYYQIHVTAYSDDSSITAKGELQLGALPIAGTGGKEVLQYPLVVKEAIEQIDNLSIYNPEYIASVWSGGRIKLSQSQTWLGSPASDTYFLAYHSGSVLTADITVEDKQLKNMEASVFFKNFLHESPAFIRHLSEDQQQFVPASHFETLEHKSGIIWFGDGQDDINLYSLKLGKPTEPVLLIVDASRHKLTTHGKIEIYGLLYIRGNWLPDGDLTVYGGIIVEGKLLANPNNLFAKTKITYQQSLIQPSLPYPGTIAIINGSQNFQ